MSVHQHPSRDDDDDFSFLGSFETFDVALEPFVVTFLDDDLDLDCRRAAFDSCAKFAKGRDLEVCLFTARFSSRFLACSAISLSCFALLWAIFACSVLLTSL